ncbi:MAG TPA: murein biosynthesis integral membrane protein MurJ, partial [Xanthomonadales bacterium]|nr:murein biosynthesis integral membrane protein MurJ [Xanthomonadales bacterium]
PNFLRRIFAEGSFSQAFVPVFTEIKQRGNPEELRDLLDHVAGALCAAVLVVTGIGILLAPWIARLFAPGALDEPEKLGLVTEMLRITFPYLFFISLTALAAGVLNSYGRFAIPALTPVLHNLSVIAAALWLSPLLAVPVKALAWGVCAAGVVQLVVQWIALARIGVLPRLRFRRAHEGVRKVLRLMLPTIFGSSVAQINLLVGTAFASLLMTGSQTWLYLTDRLLEFPQGMFGVALGTVILPHLARRFAANDAEGYSKTLDWGLRMALLVSVPATIGLFALAEPINATLYQYGKFSTFDTRMAALSLMGLSLGLPGFMVAKILAPAFYARQDTRTPVRAALVTVLVNVALMIAIVTPLWWFKVVGAHAGIAVATALAGSVNALLLWRYVRRQGLYRAERGWGRFALQMLLAAVAMAMVLYAARYWLGPWSAMAARWRIIHLAWLIPAGALVYGGALVASGLRPRHVREHA